MKKRHSAMNLLHRLSGDRAALLLDAHPPPSDTARTIKNDKLTYLSEEKLSRLEVLARLVDERTVPGAFVEFGVALGGSSILLAKLAQVRSRTFAGFDVFDMIPAPTSEFDDAATMSRYEAIKSGQSKGIDGDTYYGYRSDLLAEVESSFRRHGLDPNGADVSLHKGLFADTWPTRGPKSVALAHIDCDWYDPVAFCLGATHQAGSQGSIIVLDDYFAWSGCREAADQFLAAHRGQYRVHYGENVVLIRR